MHINAWCQWLLVGDYELFFTITSIACVGDGNNSYSNWRDITGFAFLVFFLSSKIIENSKQEIFDES
jgi:hypothetical protein